MAIDLARHGRQIRLPEVGEAGQTRLEASEVVLGGREDRLETLKGDVVRAGVKAVAGIEMPVHAKRRFQDGARSSPRARVSKAWCRNVFNAQWEERLREANDNLEPRRSGNEISAASR